MMAGTLRVRRSQGALSGVLLVLLGIWGALIPFVGPYFRYAYTPDRAFVVTSGRMWLEVLPGVVALVGGIVVLISRFRPAAVLGAWLAALAGAWFAVGGLIAGHWARLPRVGAPVGGSARAVLEQIGFFTGLGVVIVFVAALALGRFTVVAARDAAAAATADAAARAARREKTDAAPRSIARIRPVPVVLRRRSSSAADAAAGRSGAKADTAEAKTGGSEAAGTMAADEKADATQGR
jgi:hypothetical protein